MKQLSFERVFGKLMWIAFITICIVSVMTSCKMTEEQERAIIESRLGIKIANDTAFTPEPKPCAIIDHINNMAETYQNFFITIDNNEAMVLIADESEYHFNFATGEQWVKTFNRDIMIDVVNQLKSHEYLYTITRRPIKANTKKEEYPYLVKWATGLYLPIIDPKAAS